MNSCKGDIAEAIARLTFCCNRRNRSRPCDGRHPICGRSLVRASIDGVSSPQAIARSEPRPFTTFATGE
jgi:hypothetical protein